MKNFLLSHVLLLTHTFPVSYDLFFNREKPVTEREFAEYFASRANYQVTGSDAVYSNDYTGVYFSFRLEASSTADPETNPFNASFNLNYFRPHIFGLEAAPEVAAFVAHFDFQIDDPQVDGMSNGPFTEAGFLKGWNAGNTFGYRAMVSACKRDGSEVDVLTKPTALIEQVWRWNLNRDLLMDQIEQDIFIPRIMWLKVGSELFTTAIWPDGITTLIPQVDRVIIPRDNLAPRRWLFLKQKDNCLVSQGDLDGVLPPLEKLEFMLPCRRLMYQNPPPEIRRFVQSLKPPTVEMKLVAHDKVLNAELLTEALAPRPERES